MSALKLEGRGLHGQKGRIYTQKAIEVVACLLQGQQPGLAHQMIPRVHHSGRTLLPWGGGGDGSINKTVDQSIKYIFPPLFVVQPAVTVYDLKRH